ncbi:uncharacterized protein LOC113540068, partial [Pangasianodon hypophthalmus]|uniref:uncharacterized protein LOC113540068 n=1 Tax=Pangasianodon hypophthalmus TaxID=310915 RepID=UPI0023082A61
MLLLFLLFFTIADIAEAADNSIKPEKPSRSVTEGSNITLSCTYTGSVYSLHWYQQKPGSRPEFLLLIDEGSGRVTQAEPPHPRLSMKLDKMGKKVDLLISSAAVTDSALYYCALTPTVTGNTTTLYKKPCCQVPQDRNMDPVDTVDQNPSDSMADSIQPLSPREVVDEGVNVTLSCNYTTSYTGNNYLHWYRQYPKSKPEFLLYISERDSMADSIQPLSPREVVDEGVNVTLSCRYTTSYTGNNYLQWYRQYPKSKPEFLLFITPSGFKTDPLPSRLFPKVDKNKRLDLLISSAAVSDSALYYCAL